MATQPPLTPQQQAAIQALVQSGGSAGITSILGGGTAGTTQANVNPSSDYYEPEYMVMSPQGDNAAWGINNSSLSVFTGYDSGVTWLGDNQVLGAVADKLGVKHQKGKNFQDQVLAAAGKHFGVKDPTWMKLAAKLSPTAGQDLSGDESNVVRAIGQNLGVQVSIGHGAKQTMNIVDAARQIAYGGNPDQLTGLQQKLYDSGMYDDAVYNNPTVKLTPGHLDKWTIQAIGNLLTYTSGLNQGGQDVTWEQALSQAAGDVQQLGGPSILGGAKSTTVPQATQAQLALPLQQAAEKALGRLPTASELAQFTGSYDSAQQAKGAGNNPFDSSPAGGQAFDLSTGLTTAPGVPTPTAAAVPFLQSSDQTEYLGHQVANAYALLLNGLEGNYAQKALPGYNPNVTTAGSAI